MFTHHPLQADSPPLSAAIKEGTKKSPKSQALAFGALISETQKTTHPHPWLGQHLVCNISAILSDQCSLSCLAPYHCPLYFGQCIQSHLHVKMMPVPLQFCYSLYFEGIIGPSHLSLYLSGDGEESRIIHSTLCLFIIQSTVKVETVRLIFQQKSLWSFKPFLASK